MHTLSFSVAFIACAEATAFGMSNPSEKMITADLPARGLRSSVAASRASSSGLSTPAVFTAQIALPNSSLTQGAMPNQSFVSKLRVSQRLPAKSRRPAVSFIGGIVSLNSLARCCWYSSFVFVTGLTYSGCCHRTGSSIDADVSRIT